MQRKACSWNGVLKQIWIFNAFLNLYLFCASVWKHSLFTKVWTCSQETRGSGTKSEIICHYLLKTSGLKSKKRLGHIYADRHRWSESQFANLNCTVSQDTKTHFIQADRHCFSPVVQCKWVIIKVSCSVLWLPSFWIKQDETLADICRNPKVLKIFFQLDLELYVMLFQKYQISQIFVQY